MALDQIPTEERTAPLKPSQVPVEMGLGRVSCLSLFVYIRAVTVIPGFSAACPKSCGLLFTKAKNCH